jgi:hypothetical protein
MANGWRNPIATYHSSGQWISTQILIIHHAKIGVSLFTVTLAF